jgi:uncharacterized membrane protein
MFAMYRFGPVRIPAFVLRSVIAVIVYLLVQAVSSALGAGNGSYLLGFLVCLASFIHITWAERQADEALENQPRE